MDEEIELTTEERKRGNEKWRNHLELAAIL